MTLKVAGVLGESLEYASKKEYLGAMNEQRQPQPMQAFVRSLNVLLKSVRLYGDAHERVTAQMEEAWRQLQSALPPAGEPTLALGVSGSQLLVDGVPVGDTPVERGFAQMLTTAGVSSIQFSAQATQKEFVRFVQAFAAAGAKPKNVAEQLSSALGEGAGISVNEVRFVQEDAALADAHASAQLAVGALGIDAQQVQALLGDPLKLLQSILVTDGSAGTAAVPAEEKTADSVAPIRAGSAPVAASPVPLEEAELVAALRLLAQLGRATSQPETAGQIPAQAAKLSPAAQANLQQALSGLAAKAPPQPNRLVLLRLAEHLAIRHAIERYERGEVQVNAVSELLDRMSHEIMVLRKMLKEERAMVDTQAPVVSEAEALEHQFWASLPPEGRHSVLQADQAWCVPPQYLRQAVETLQEKSEDEHAAQMLINYASCLRNPNPQARGRTARGLSFLVDLYARSFCEVLEAAFEDLCAQMAAETVEEVQRQFAKTFAHLVREVDDATSPLMGKVDLACSVCGESRLSAPARPELLEALRSHPLRVQCAGCQTTTQWTITEPIPSSKGAPIEPSQPTAEPAPAPRAAGTEARRSRRVHMKMSIRVRSEDPAQSFTEVSSTDDISRHGALFSLSRPLDPGTEVFVLVPYNEGDALPETRARVVRCRRVEDKFQVAVELQP